MPIEGTGLGGHLGIDSRRVLGQNPLQRTKPPNQFLQIQQSGLANALHRTGQHRFFLQSAGRPMKQGHLQKETAQLQFPGGKSTACLFQHRNQLFPGFHRLLAQAV